ncbi:MAG: ABC transporter ATP-binding protein [Clostridia bacterium]|nr:ABC transporter ATP-binding protein [Clostridia bacterium]
MTEEKKKRSLAEDLRLITRGFKTMFKISRSGMIWRIVNCIVQQISPYFWLYMSALIIDEIAAGADLKRLLILALITVTGQFVLNIAVHYVGRKTDEAARTMFGRIEYYYFCVNHRMQYKYFEKPDTALMLETIRSSHNYGGWGLMRIYWGSWNIVAATFNIIASTALTFTMLRSVSNASLTGLLAFMNSPWSSIIILLLIAINVFSSLVRTKYFSTKEQKAWKNVEESLSLANCYFNGNGMDERIFNISRFSLARMKSIYVENPALDKAYAASRNSTLISLLFQIILQAGLFIYVAAKAFIGVFGIGSFVLYSGTVGRFVSAVSDLVGQLNMWRVNNEYLKNEFKFIDLPDEMYQGTLSTEKRDDNKYEIEFRNVSFKYPGSENYALKNVNFKFNIGERLAFVGMNGSGKTTFVKLLCRLYDPTEGQILLNGIDITRYDYDQYMALFSVVFQDYAVFAFDIAGNVSASSEPDRDRVLDCLARAGLGERISELENGIDTFITKNYDATGVDFSGGEKQKIAIARALYKDAPFIILDEPTASLDPLAEADIYARFNEIVTDKTAVYISHRLSSCRFCDKIVVFDNGEIIQQGDHETLVADENGKYFELWHAQAQHYV